MLNMATPSSSDLWREFTWKNILRFFYYQSKNAEDSKCWRRWGYTPAGHFHIFWECPKIAPYWTYMIRRIRVITALQFERSFGVFYLGNILAGLRQWDIYLLQILLAASKKAITHK